MGPGGRAATGTLSRPSDGDAVHDEDTRGGAGRAVGLVAVDVDGTLLERDASLPAARAASFERLVARVPTMLATGKTAPSITGLVHRHGPVGPHAICNGAALLHADDRIEVLAALANDVVEEVLDVLRSHDVAAACYLADGSVVAPAPDPRFAAITELGEPAPEVAAVDGRTVLKVLAVLDEADEGGTRSLAADRARVQRTGPSFLEWNAPDASKGRAVATVADRHGVPMAAVVAVGDSENDVTMLAAAGWGVAVADSSAAAVAAADEHLDADVGTLFDRLVAG